MTKKIFWDKGHGGTDPGAMGNGLHEKILTDKIVNYAVDYLNNNYIGFVQMVSSNNDESLTLDQRTDMANNWDADVLVSVHINSAANKAANGFESHIYNNNPGASTIALQNMVHAEVYNEMKPFGVSNDRGKKRSNFHMLRESKMAALLTENLFIVNTNDANKLKNESFLKTVGEAHARGVAKFLGLLSKPIRVEVNKKYRLVTGTFSEKEQAEKAAAKLRNENGWLVYIKEI